MVNLGSYINIYADKSTCVRSELLDSELVQCSKGL
jgi:hypothetical protein